MSDFDLAELAPTALLLVDGTGQILAVNPAAEALLGQSKRALVTENLAAFGGELIALLRRAQGLGSTLSAQGVKCLSYTGEEVSGDVRLRLTVAGHFAIAFHHQSDREEINSNSELARFAHVLGHEIKNPLAGISGAAQLLARSNLSENESQMLEIIRDETARIGRLIDSLSSFELFSAPKRAPFNIHALLDKVISAEEAAFDGQVKYLRLFDPSLPPVLGDADHLHEVFLNLMRNGAEAALYAQNSSNSPQIEIKTAYVTGFSMRSLHSFEAKRGAIEVHIVDNGPGILIEDQGQIFEAFQSSKSTGRGLGLAVVREVILAHEAQIKLESRPGRTRFSVFLPLAE